MASLAARPAAWAGSGLTMAAPRVDKNASRRFTSNDKDVAAWSVPRKESSRRALMILTMITSNGRVERVICQKDAYVSVFDVGKKSTRKK